MLKRKCSGCGEKIERKFHYCPWCGKAPKAQSERTNYGMLGREDHIAGNQMASELKLPFGVGKILDSLMKQIEREIGNMDNVSQTPKGIKIKVSRGMPGQMMPRKMAPKVEAPKLPEIEVSDKEQSRRAGLPKVEAKSRIKRIGDEIIYELEVPGIKSEKDLEFSRVEGGIEVRAYTKDFSYTKVLPIRLEGLNFSTKKDKVILESRS